MKPRLPVLNPLAHAPGIEKFYGFVGAEDNMWEPTIHDGVTIVDAPAKDRITSPKI